MRDEVKAEIELKWFEADYYLADFCENFSESSFVYGHKQIKFQINSHVNGT
jgi:hypothetical protein